MKKRNWALGALIAAGLTTIGILPATSTLLSSAEAAPAPARYTFQEAWPGVVFDMPIDVAYLPDGTDRLLVAQRGGKVVVLPKYRGTGAVGAPKTFLDVSKLFPAALIDQGQGGLLSIAVHPAYKTNGRFAIFYGTGTGTAEDPYRSVVAVYKVGAGPDAADPASAQIVLTVPKKQMIHFGGGLAFGRDGMLYIGIGDTGMTDDPDRVAQDTRTLEGKILRLDVTSASAAKPYVVPGDNPWPAAEGVKAEIFAYGVRNPFRISFDRQTGALWMGDPGQKRKEELSLVPRAGNLGWGIMEADLPLAEGAKPSQYVAPVFAWGREMGQCSIGGSVYRGQRCTGLVGKVVFGDFMSGKVWALPLKDNASAGAPEPVGDCASVSAIKEDAEGELYLTALEDGKVYTIVPGA
jgi:glucose/arabinose dehydrogenase